MGKGSSAKAAAKASSPSSTSLCSARPFCFAGLSGDGSRSGFRCECHQYTEADCKSRLMSDEPSEASAWYSALGRPKYTPGWSTAGDEGALGGCEAGAF